MLWLLPCLLATSPGPAKNNLEDLEGQLNRHTQDRYAADLEEIKRRRVLRVLTRNNSSAYFIARGAQRGFEYELAKAFADELGVRLAIVVPPSRSALIKALLHGEGDLIAAGMSVTPARSEKVLFTNAVLASPRVVVTHPLTVKEIRTLADLPAFEIAVSFRSTTYRDAKAIENQLGVPLLLRDITDGVEMEEMMRRVSRGDYEATIVDSDLLGLAHAEDVQVEARLSVGAVRKKAWAVHPGAENLKVAADRFLRGRRKSGLVRILYVRYYRPESRFARRARDRRFRADAKGQISPYDEIFKAQGRAVGLDWRLLAAVAYSESRFKPHAKSGWGAVGLMQVLPSTAREMRVFGDLLEPENNVRAGARYLRWLIRQFDRDGVKKRRAIRMALAAYNAGVGHIHDARALASKIGRDRNRWFRNVEEALLLKKQAKWHEKTRYGYCRAGETVRYVSAVQSRYDVYARHVPL